MITELNCRILENRPLGPDCFQLLLEAEQEIEIRPGQFVEVTVPGFSLRRPISVTDVEDGVIRLTCQIVGTGTAALAGQKDGMLSVLAPLGNGFTLPEEGSELLAVGGGIGTAPLIGLIREAVKRNCRVTAVFGFRTPQQALFREELSALPLRSFYAFESEGENVITLLRREGYENIPFAACGPVSMMEAVDEIMQADGEFSAECRMGCGFGACMGCSVETRSGMKRICKDGPVFRRGELLWKTLR